MFSGSRNINIGNITSMNQLMQVGNQMVQDTEQITKRIEEKRKLLSQTEERKQTDYEIMRKFNS
jgi:hypothetical protein